MADRRDFLKTMAIGGASALVAPSLLSSCASDKKEDTILDTSAGGLIVPKDNGLRITGTFLDEISHTFRTRTGVRRNGTRTLPT